jgi:hypothetical protein
MPSGYDPMGGYRFSEKITHKQRGQIMIRFDRIMIWAMGSYPAASAGSAGAASV